MEVNKTITIDTAQAVFTGLTTAQKDRLRRLGYTDADLKSAEAMYEALRPCSQCNLDNAYINSLHEEIHQLKQNREFFEGHFQKIIDTIKEQSCDSGLAGTSPQTTSGH